jgi:type IV pilus assembly protein PilE
MAQTGEATIFVTYFRTRRLSRLCARPSDGFATGIPDAITFNPIKDDSMTTPGNLLRALPARRASGFTLIEMMIVVAIVAILSMIGIPSYNNYVTRAKRAVAKQFMLTIASKQEQYLLDARQYASNIDNGTIAPGGQLNLTTPPEVVYHYTFSLDPACSTTPPCTTFTIKATAIGKQATDGWLKLDNLGQKTSEYADKW